MLWSVYGVVFCVRRYRMPERRAEEVKDSNPESAEDPNMREGGENEKIEGITYIVLAAPTVSL